MKYVIESSHNKMVKTADNMLEAAKIAKQLSNVFGVLFVVKEVNDVWEVNNYR